MRGYKAFNKDWTCRGKQYQVGKTFTEDVDLKVCERGMHFSKQLQQVFNFYPFDPDQTIVAEVEALGDVVTEDNSKFCTNKLQIIREIPWDEVQKRCNTGNCNTGDWNTGNRNTGNCNTGNRNTGDYNMGDCNTGDWNKSSFNNGCFMTVEPKIMLFNKPSDWTYRDWCDSGARWLLNQIPKNVSEWICSSDMSEDEKTAHPEYKTTKGYLKILDESESAQLWWDALPDEEREVIKALPNFDADIFLECTGININRKRI